MCLYFHMHLFLLRSTVALHQLEASCERIGITLFTVSKCGYCNSASVSVPLCSDLGHVWCVLCQPP